MAFSFVVRMLFCHCQDHIDNRISSNDDINVSLRVW